MSGFKSVSTSLIACAITAALSLSGCNLFSPIDKPGSDPQYLSAARACFDQGDISCAQENYSKLSSSYSDTVAAETSFLTLKSAGASMANIMEFVGNLVQYSGNNQGSGVAMTLFANSLTSGAGMAKRNSIWQIYSSVSSGSIKDTSLKNFVLFITSVSLAAEILAEGAEGTNTLQVSDLVNSGNCANQGASCAVSAQCQPPAGASLVRGTDTFTVNTSSTNVNPTTLQLSVALTNAAQALANLSASGKFANLSTDLTNLSTISQSLDLTSSAGDACYRESLLLLGFGTNSL